MTSLDSIDKTIIRLLMEDGRMPAVKIARCIDDISERAVHHRIDRLLRQGIIRVSAVVDPRVVGFAVRADVLLDVEPGRVQEVAERLVEFEQVHFVACSFGNHDVSVTVYAHDNAALYTYLAETITAIPGIKEATTILTPVVLKDVYDWRIPGIVRSQETRKPFFPPQVEVYKIDRIGRDITHLLIEDGRMPAAEIARRLGGITARSVRDYIETLTQQWVFRVTAILAPEKVGFPVRADILVKIESRRVLDVARKLTEFDETTYVGCSIGSTDVSVQICARDNMEVYRFVTEALHRIPGVTGTVTTLVPLILKDAYDWHIPDFVCREFQQE